MFAMNRLRLLVAAIVVSALAALLALAAFSSAATANHSWGNYHWAWESDSSFTLKLGDNVSTGWDSYLATTASDVENKGWGYSSVLDTKVVPGTKNPKTCRPTSGQVEVCNATYGNTGWLGVAQIWASGSHITQGTVKNNDTYFNTARYNTPAWRNMVMCQEVGHTLGLDHVDELFNNPNLGTCMDYTNDPSGTAGTNGSLNNEYPYPHDYDQLVTMNGLHKDSISTVSTSAASRMPAAANQRDLNSRAEWGRLIRESRNEQLALYERGFGDGNKVFTFVIWA